MTAPQFDPHLFVVFGATGDLSARKLLPALREITDGSPARHPTFAILGCGRRPMTDAEFQTEVIARWKELGLPDLPASSRWARRHLRYASLGTETPEEFRRLSERIAAVEREYQLPGNRVLYLALPADAFEKTIRGVGEAGLHRSAGWTRLVIEKPFGTDLPSAERLNRVVHSFFDERHVYRIDHYLGKETVQNLIVFRLANMFFESVWNRDRIDFVEITVAEQLGVEHRGAYYEGVGALRDMVQSHLTQLLTLTAMDEPTNLEADEVRNEKVKVLRCVEPIRPEDVVRGQYRSGRIDGARVRGYRQEPGVPRRSTTETFVALRLRVNSWRWHGVPFYLRTGKRLPAKRTEIVIHFRSPPVWFFGTPIPRAIRANRLTITLQPDEGFELAFEIKRPGLAVDLETHRLHFLYSEAFGPLPDAYHTLLSDILRGDQTLFVRGDEVEEAWRIYGPLLNRPPPLRPYASGSWGPKESEALVRADGYEWANH
ncbi:MAG TPA: glucose-6-phosphate dehydrogenase [Thermoplasmata archaeon]|nr:glucose-6-phosphate dehydrogenase [Thermoplasmata archaeon]